MSIRWKLFLSLFALTAGAIVLVLVVAEREFRGWVRGEIEQRFEAQLAGLLEARAERLAGTREWCVTLAKHPALIAALEGKESKGLREEFMEEFLKTRSGGPGSGRGRPRGGGGRPAGEAGVGRGLGPTGGGRGTAEPESGGQMIRRGLNQARRLPIIGVLDLAGRPIHFGHPVTRSAQARREAAQRLGEMIRHPRQAVGYIVLDGSGTKRAMVQEVVLTPVVKDGDLLGWFFLGQDAETQIERSFQAAERTSGREGRFGLVAQGQWFIKGFTEEEVGQITAQLDDDFWQNGEPEVLKLGEKTYIIVGSHLNRGSPMGSGYEVALFPVDSLIEALLHLRGTVAWLGVGTLVVIGLLAMILAQRFSRPIAELVAGTERIRRGDLTGEVRVGSKDEFGVLATAFNAMTEGLALRDRYREVLGKVSDPSVARQLMDGKLELGGEVRHAAVLFCDIRGFTAMTEGMDPAEVIEFLNEHMTMLTKLVYLHDGVVDKFVGDLIMAIFGAPQSQGDDALRAARCAVGMMEERGRLNETTGRVVEVGIGLAYGELVAGCMGSTDRLNYTVLGDRVNLAARLCSAAGVGEILVDEEIASSLDESMVAEPREPIVLKGFAEPVASFVLRRSG